MTMVDEYVAIHGMPFDDWTNTAIPADEAADAA